AHRNFAAVLQMQARPEEAVVHYRTALKLKPDDDAAAWDLAYALHGLGKLREAAEFDRYVLRLKPEHTRALNDLAWILATDPDPALRNASEAISAAHK